MAITKSAVVINQSSAGTATVLDDDGDKTSRIHYVFGTVQANGTVAFQGISGGGNLIPPFEVLADTPFQFGPIEDIDLCPSVAKQGIQVVSTGGGFKGVVGVSQGSLGSAAP